MEGREIETMEESAKDELTEILLNTREQCQMVDALIHHQIEVKDEMIDKLHKELEYYKNDSAERFVVQLMKAVIKIRKDMIRRMSSQEWETMSETDVKREYEYICEDITDLLQQQNIDDYVTETGANFDPAIHQAKIEQTADEKLDRKIKRSLSEGYKKDNKVLLAERVIVYQYKNKE